MKKFLLFFLIFWNYELLFSQRQDLENLAEGNIAYADILYDSDHNLFGYIYFFDQGRLDEKYNQFEYILLDRNLNKVASNTFKEEYYDGISSQFYDCTYMGDEIIFSKYLHRKDDLLLTFSRLISLKENTVSKEFIYENEEFKDLNTSSEELKKTYKRAESINVTFAVNNKNIHGFFVTEKNKKRKNYLEKDFKIYNSDKNLKWSYPYNPNGTKKDWYDFQVLNTNDGIIIGGVSHMVNDTWADEYKIIGLDVETGKKLFEYMVENKDSQYNHTINIRNFGDKVYIVGNYSPYSKKDFDWKKNLGVFSITLDKNGNELSKKYYPWSEIASNQGADKYGVVKGGYYLSPMKFYILKDGSFSYLAEKFKGNNKRVNATDFVLFNFDSNGNFKSNNLIIKEKSTVFKNDYLFHQYIKDNTGVVFFYRDFNNSDRSWVLGINTIINGEFKEEIIPMSSKDFYIQPIPAKEGYIMLHEFNERDKFNQIRLEKLNY